jgi:hypothetical protein
VPRGFKVDNINRESSIQWYSWILDIETLEIQTCPKLPYSDGVHAWHIHLKSYQTPNYSWYAHLLAVTAP